MSDNTTNDQGQLFSSDAGPIAQVREGMTVKDAAGETLGTVEEVQIGDPDAATTRGITASPDEEFTAVIGSLFGGSVDVPEPKLSQLLRYGFIRVDASSLTDADRFIRSDQIKSVSGDTVLLKVRRDQLLAEQ